MLRRAAIDIGTNSVRLLVADLRESSPLTPEAVLAGLPVRPVLRRLVITRLGEGLAVDGLIREAAAERTAEVVQQFAEAAEGIGAPAPAIFATYAVRAARNPSVLLARVPRPVQVLKGEEEARLGFLGAIAGLGDRDAGTAILVLDIGGGSIELTLGTPCGVRESHSFPLGCVVLTQQFLAHDPPQNQEVTALRAYVATTVGPLLERAVSTLDAVVGVGGTITTMAALAQRLTAYDPDRVHGYRLALPQIEDTLGVLQSRSLNDRRSLPGLQPERADVIIAGALVLRDVVERLGGRTIEVSEADLLWGVLVAAGAPQ